MARAVEFPIHGRLPQGGFRMNKLTVVAAAVGALCFAASASAQVLKGPVNDKPITEHWFPSKWGADGP